MIIIGYKIHIAVQLYRWCIQGKVMALRRGLYALADPYRKTPLSPLRLANELYKPSYLSGEWALSYYGLIPEKTVTYTSVTPRVTRTFQNQLGTFAYSSLKPDFFWGFSAQTIDATPVWIAEPEKVLLDYWHLMHGEWTTERLSEMRFQNTEQLDLGKLKRYAKKWGSPRLERTTRRFEDVTAAEMKGTRTL